MPMTANQLSQQLYWKYAEQTAHTDRSVLSATRRSISDLANARVVAGRMQMNLKDLWNSLKPTPFDIWYIFNRSSYICFCVKFRLQTSERVSSSTCSCSSSDSNTYMVDRCLCSNLKMIMNYQSCVFWPTKSLVEHVTSKCPSDWWVRDVSRKHVGEHGMLIGLFLPQTSCKTSCLRPQCSWLWLMTTGAPRWYVSLPVHVAVAGRLLNLEFPNEQRRHGVVYMLCTSHCSAHFPGNQSDCVRITHYSKKDEQNKPYIDLNQ